MDIRKMKYFISVAKTLNFTKAAKQHYISQTAMSQQIASVEEELGVLLIDRSRYKVELTEAGKVFLGETIIIVEKYEQAVRKTRTVYHGSKGSITCGYIDLNAMELLHSVVETFNGEYPNVDVCFDKQCFKVLEDKLMNDTCDIIFSQESELKNLHEVEKLILFRAKMFLAVSKKHPKADCGKIDAYEVAKEKILVVNEEEGPNTIKHMIECCLKDGYEPYIEEKVPTFDTLMLMVGLNRGVAFLPDILLHKLNDKITFLELENSHHTLAVGMAWRKDNKNPFINFFVESAKRRCSDVK